MDTDSAPDSAQFELKDLTGLFFTDQSDLGEFTKVRGGDVIQPQRSLLDHDFHMTVTLEKFHSSAVDVDVLQTCVDGSRYARKILLTRQSDDQVVQFGIVRLNFDLIKPEVVSEIRAHETPLGRILINHDVMRRVKLLTLYEIGCGDELAEAFGAGGAGKKLGDKVYGRTALIYLDDSPAIELLEIVTV